MKEYGGLQRNRYFRGRLFGDEDLTVEQTYFIEKQRRHNQYLHGWGVVNGVEVSIDDSKVFVEAGIGIDCAGNEIFLETKVNLDAPKSCIYHKKKFRSGGMSC